MFITFIKKLFLFFFFFFFFFFFLFLLVYLFWLDALNKQNYLEKIVITCVRVCFIYNSNDRIRFVLVLYMFLFFFLQKKKIGANFGVSLILTHLFQGIEIYTNKC